MLTIGPAPFYAPSSAPVIATCEEARGKKYKLESYPLAPGTEIEMKAIPGMGH
jgi:hypothetical protein